MRILHLTFLAACLLISFTQCGIKNDKADVSQEPGTEIDSNSTSDKPASTDQSNPMLGYWVGYFEKDLGDESYDKDIYADDAFYWSRENKINVSIDRIEGDSVFGHSVVAGNDRPFKGTLKQNGNATSFEVQEPGDDKYDGKFSFSIKGDTLSGTWQAFQKIDVSKRKYALTKKTYSYNPDIMLEEKGAYVDWNSKKMGKMSAEQDEFVTQFETTTDKIYQINASNKLLTKEEVANLKQGDILIIRNTIYARHGYSFKKRPIRVFFDAQDWYIPVQADIKDELTEIEKKNIELLLRYEKNAKKYYDYFGRG